MNRSLKRRFTRNPGHQGVELENHFVLRLPQPQASNLRELLRSNQSSNIKDRLNLQLDYTQDKEDMRNGIITVDTIMYKSRLVDMPTILESWKTTDGKNFYKTADMCQMLMVREGEDPAEEEEEESKKKRKDHPNRVDKKYLWPHGYTPPLKNVRKRRFRKMLRKKILELPEIEKEVKRLLRADEEALSVKWEVLKEEDEKGGGAGGSGGGGGGDGDRRQDCRGGALAGNLDEQLFGEMVSSSEDEVGPTINIMDEDEDSRLSVEDTRFSEPYTQDAPNSPHALRQQQYQQHPPGDAEQYFPSTSPPLQQHQQYSSHNHHPSTSYHQQQEQQYPTQFTSSMFRGGDNTDSMLYRSDLVSGGGLMSGEAGGGYDSEGEGYDDANTMASDGSSTMLLSNMQAVDDGSLQSSRDTGGLVSELVALEQHLSKLLAKREGHQAHLDGLENLALKTRFLSKLTEVDTSIHGTQQQISRIQSALQD